MHGPNSGILASAAAFAVLILFARHRRAVRLPVGLAEEVVRVVVLAMGRRDGRFADVAQAMGRVSARETEPHIG